MHELPDFYGDLFQINGCGVAIFGFGKTQVTRMAVGYSVEAELVTDHLFLRRDGDVLLAELDYARHGRYSTLPRWHQINAFVRCLGGDETESVYKHGPRAIREIDLETFIRACRWNIGYPMSAENLGERLAEREPVFRSLVEGAVTRFALVPWMETPEEKAELYRQLAWT